MNFGNKLLELRTEAGLSQDEVAEKLNLSRQAISKWENNANLPDFDNLVLLSDLYNFNLNDLLKNNLTWKERITLTKQRILHAFAAINSNELEGYLLVIISFLTFTIIPISLVVSLFILWINKKNNTYHKLILVLCIISILYAIFSIYIDLSVLFEWGVTTSVSS